MFDLLAQLFQLSVYCFIVWLGKRPNYTNDQIQIGKIDLVLLHELFYHAPDIISSHGQQRHFFADHDGTTCNALLILPQMQNKMPAGNAPL